MTETERRRRRQQHADRIRYGWLPHDCVYWPAAIESQISIPLQLKHLKHTSSDRCDLHDSAIDIMAGPATRGLRFILNVERLTEHTLAWLDPHCEYLEPEDPKTDREC